MAASQAVSQSAANGRPSLPRPQTLLALVRAVALATFAATGPVLPSRILGGAALYVVGACVLGNLRPKWRDLDVVLLALTVSADIAWCAAAFLYFGPMNTLPLVLYAALVAGVVASVSDIAAIAVAICSAAAYCLTAFYARRSVELVAPPVQLVLFQAAFIALAGILCGAVAGQWRRLRRARQTVERLKRLNHETGHEAVSRGRTAVLQAAAESARRIFDAPRAWVMRADKEGQALALVAGTGLEPMERQETLTREHAGLAWEVFDTGQSVLASARSRRSPGLSGLEARLSLGHLMAAAVEDDGTRIGVLVVSRPAEAEGFSEEDLAVLALLTRAVTGALRTAGLIRDLHRSSTTDSLTGLHNHGCFLARLAEQVQRARESAEELSLIVLDMDGFKHINDTAGHWEGNRVLQALADALQRECREQDVIARCGGDEFAVLLPGTGPEQAAQVAERAGAALQRATIRPGVRTPISASWGIASYPWDASTDEALFRRADDRLYEAKQAGGNHLAFDPIVLGEESRGSCVRPVGSFPPSEEAPA